MTGEIGEWGVSPGKLMITEWGVSPTVGVDTSVYDRERAIAQAHLDKLLEDWCASNGTTLVKVHRWHAKQRLRRFPVKITASATKFNEEMRKFRRQLRAMGDQS